MGYVGIIITFYNMSILSDRLRELRGSQSQAEISRQRGMKQPQWARYENGVSAPSIDVLEKICRIHAVSADWLLGLKDDNNDIVISSRHSTCNHCPYKKEALRFIRAINSLEKKKDREEDVGLR